jgi:hypothetical protein
MRLLKNLEVNKKEFNSIIQLRNKQKKSPVLLAFLTPSFMFFDLFRIAKLAQLASEDIFLILIIKDDDKEKMKKFENLINLVIPKNKMIYKYLDIYYQLIKDDKFRKILSLYKINKLFPRINSLTSKQYVNKRNLSFSDIESFLTQDYVAKNSQRLFGGSPDFFLTSNYKDSFFNCFGLNKGRKMATIKVSDTPYNFNLLEDLSVIEKELNLLKPDLKKEKEMGEILNFIIEMFNYPEKFDDFREATVFLKKKLLNSKNVEEMFLDKNNFIDCITAINNPLRRDILGIIKKNKKLKAGTIRAEINKMHSKKYTLTSIIKNLEILSNSKILIKKDRYYELLHQRIIMNLPIEWMLRAPEAQNIFGDNKRI